MNNNIISTADGMLETSNRENKRLQKVTITKRVHLLNFYFTVSLRSKEASAVTSELVNDNDSISSRASDNVNYSTQIEM
jgi:hypothetical protein